MSVSLRQQRWISVGVVAVLVAGLLFFASRVDGNVIPEPDIHDGGVWVTNEAGGVFGRTNAQIGTVDTRLVSESNTFDIYQSGNIVVLRQGEPSTLTGVDPARSRLIPGPDLPPDAEIGLGANTAALFNPRDGSLFVTSVKSSSAVLALDPAGELEPVDTVEGDGQLAVGPDGLVHLLDLEQSEVRTWDSAGQLVKTTAFDGDLVGAQLTAVGDRPVLLGSDGMLHLPDRDPMSLGLMGTPVVQEPGPAAPGVLVAGESSLIRVSFGGDTEELFSDGTGAPARPVRVAGCDYAAWGGAPVFAQICDGSDPLTGSIGEMDAASDLRFRVNRSQVTLNNLSDGSQLLFGDGDPVYIDNQWADAINDEIEEDPDAQEEVDQQAAPTCENEENSKPIAEPDDGIFGTRPGRPVIVHPLRNDADPDCDVLLITSIEVSDRDAGTAGIINGGRSVQVDMDPAADRFRFDYTISDGRGGSASSFAVVRQTPDSQNEPPVLARDETFVVTGGTVTHNVLATAYDPDGDVMRVTDARIEGVSDGSAGEVKPIARGEITFTAGNVAGNVEITYVVSDGRGGEATGVLTVTVADRRENQTPVARNDSVSTFVGRDVVVDVLDNDDDPNGQQLSIVRAVTTSDATVRWSDTSPEIRVRSDKAGTVNVVYTVTDGAATDQAVLRVDFREQSEPKPPIAVRDEVLLSGGEPAFVPVLDNDVDPEGEVLIVLGVSGLPDNVPVEVTILRRAILKISSPTDLAQPFEFTYRISDGNDVDDGTVLVEPAPVQSENRPPVVVADEYTVRAGGIVSLPVLSNDSDPDGDPLSVVEPDGVADGVANRDGRLFLSDSGELRYEAPRTAKPTVPLIYSVADTADNVASAELIIHVLPANGNRNQPPIAPGLVGRTIAGQRATIPIPVTTMDPDGDSVTLLGVETPPQMGTIVDVGTDELIYEADRTAAGTDEFTYKVVDQFGEEAVGTILVGVAGLPERNNPPVPADDEAAVQPGQTVSIDVIGNDFDPDADPLAVSTEEDHVVTPSLGSAEVDGGSIIYTAPTDPDVARTTFRYVASDGRGGYAEARVTIMFRGDGDNRPPAAADDAVEPQAPGAELSLPLLDNDEDPDDDPLVIESTTLQVEGLEGGGISATGRTVDFIMPTEPVQFTYVISDGRGGTSRAAVFVPLLDPEQNRPPVTELDTATVDIGQSVTVDVLGNDTDPDGDSLHLFRVLGARHGSVEIEGNRVVFTASEERYLGDAGFSYVVGDTDDPATAATAMGAVKLKITGELNEPPSFTELAVQVPQGGSRSVDLASAVVDPDTDDSFDFSITDGPDGVDASVNGSALQVSAPLDAAPGTTTAMTVEVSDGTDTATGAVNVEVISSDRPLPEAVGDSAETVQGVPVTIDVLTNDVNPFPDQALDLDSVGTPTGGAGSATVTDGALTFTPTESFFGDTSFTYSVLDATGDTTRKVSGTVSVTVIGRPSAPPAPTCISGTSESVRVQWVAPSANGAPITGYTVIITDEAGNEVDRRSVPNASTQDIGGLTNGTTYRFQVGAVNRAVTDGSGVPELSQPSPPCTPDEVPGQPPPPVTDFGDQQLTITWDPAATPNNGSAVIAQHLTNTTTGETQELGPNVGTYTWEPLENGTSYRFTLTAENDLDRGPTSDLSTGDPIPAGVPQAPAKPNAQGEIGNRDGFLVVRWTWSAAKNNGDAVSNFRIQGYRNGVPMDPVVVGGATREQRFATDNGVDYEFTVAAKNKAGWSQDGVRSDVAVSAGVPQGQATVTASEGDTASKLTINGSNVDANGAPISQWQYDINNNANWRPVPSDNLIRNLTNGTRYTFRVRAVNSEGPGQPSVASNAVRPYGNPTTPNISGSKSGDSVSFSWSGGGPNGRPLHNPKYQIKPSRNCGSFSGGAWTATGTTSLSCTIGYHTTITVSVRVVADNTDAARKFSAVDSVSRTTGGPPAPDVPARVEQRRGTCSNGSNNCTVWSVDIRGGQPNTTYDVVCRFYYDNNDDRQPDGGSYSSKNMGSHRTDGNGFNAVSGRDCRTGSLRVARVFVTPNSGPQGQSQILYRIP